LGKQKGKDVYADYELPEVCAQHGVCGFQLVCYRPNSEQRKVRLVKWSKQAVLGKASTQANDVRVCNEFHKTLDNDKDYIPRKRNKKILANREKGFIGGESWNWPLMPTSKNEPELKPHFFLTAAGAHLPVMSWFG